VPNRNLVFYLSTQDQNFVSPFACSLLQRHQLSTVLLHNGPFGLPNPSVPLGYAFSFDDFTESIDIEELLRPGNGSLGTQAIRDHAQDIEDRLGLRILDAIRSDRHVGWGFVSGGVYPRSRFGVIEHDTVITIAIKVVHFIEKLFDRLDPAACVTSYSTLFGNLLGSVAEAKDIPVRTRASTRAGNKANWAVDRYFTPFKFDESYELEIRPEASYETQVMTTSPRAEYWFGQVPEWLTVRFLLAGASLAIKTELAYLRDVRKGRDSIYGHLFLWDSLKQLFHTRNLRRKYYRESQNASSNFETQPKTPFVLYPMHIEPESTLMSESQMCDDQRTIIDWLAKALPAGLRLICKEHPGLVAPRPKGFLEQILRYPNVELLNPFVDIQGVIDAAEVVATINGTSGLQAAVAGKPVLTFHPQFLALKLPHVLYANSFESCQQALRLLLSEISNMPLTSRQRDGARLMAAMERNAVEMDDEGLAYGFSSGKELSERFIVEYSDLFIRSLHEDNSQ
jgi:hypothetical protein